MQLIRTRRGTWRRANVSVEFALLATLFLLPLFGGSIDLVQYISAKAQLNTALQSLYYYSLTYVPGSYTPGTPPRALADPDGVVSAANTSKVLALMAHKVRPLTLVNGYPVITYSCVNQSGAVLYPAPTENNDCTTAYPYERISVQYQIQTVVSFIVPMPFVSATPLTLIASGSVEIF